MSLYRAVWGEELLDGILDSCKVIDSCFVWQRSFTKSQRSSGGIRGCYPKIGYRYDDTRYWLRANRVVYALHHNMSFEEMREMPQINHTCNNSMCLNPDHMYLGTQSENGRDMALAGNTHTQKLMPDDVRDIRLMIQEGYMNKEIAEYHGVSQTTISHIKCGRSWAWLE